MNCQEFVLNLSALIDNELSPERTEEALAHLRTCNNCHIVLTTTQKTLLLSKEALMATLPAERKERLLSSIQLSYILGNEEE